MNKVERALMAAEVAHANQKYDIFPYMYHVRMVLKQAQNMGYDEAIQVACVLHDTMEDDALSYNKIKKFFGEEVAEIVYCVTDELGRNRKDRKVKTYPKIRNNWKATVVKICDRLANFEQSIAYNQGKAKMYIDEHDTFVNELRNSDHPMDVNVAWSALESMVRPYTKTI